MNTNYYVHQKPTCSICFRGPQKFVTDTHQSLVKHYKEVHSIENYGGAMLAIFTTMTSKDLNIIVNVV
jgi:hypothetical protein